LGLYATSNKCGVTNTLKTGVINASLETNYKYNHFLCETNKEKKEKDCSNFQKNKIAFGYIYISSK